jgi:hypothetical protein
VSEYQILRVHVRTLCVVAPTASSDCAVSAGEHVAGAKLHDIDVKERSNSSIRRSYAMKP